MKRKAVIHRNSASRFWTLNRTVTITIAAFPFAFFAALFGYLFWLDNTGVAGDLNTLGKRAKASSQIGDPPDRLTAMMQENGVECSQHARGDYLNIACGTEVSRNSLLPLDFCCTFAVEATYENGSLMAPIVWRLDH